MPIFLSVKKVSSSLLSMDDSGRIVIGKPNHEGSLPAVASGKMK